MKILLCHRKRDSGISLIECLAYISGLAIVMGLAYGAYYRCMATSNGMRRNATDIVDALQCGERWREDVRRATGDLSVSEVSGRQTVRIPQKSGVVIYVFENGTIERSADGKNWNAVLPNVKTSQIKKDERKQVVAWRWEVELNSRKDAKVSSALYFRGSSGKKMKIALTIPPRRNQNGSAVLIVMILLGAMLVFVASNTTNLNHLKRELNVIEQKQLKRVHATEPAAGKINPAKP